MSDASPTASDSPTPSPPWPFTAVLAWLVPGLGHYLIGYRRRGLILGLTILTLFTLGLLIGGIGVVDHQQQRLWFAGQTLIGPVAPIVSLYRQSREAQLAQQREDMAESMGIGYRANDASVLRELLASDEPPAIRKSLGRVNELGTLYCTLAGVLNLLVILDVIGRSSSAPIHPAPPPRDPPDSRRGKLVTREEQPS